MAALGMTASHLGLQILNSSIILSFFDRLPDTELIFGIDIQKKFSISYAW